MLILPDHWTWDFWLTTHQNAYHLYFLMAPTALGDPDLRHVNARVGHAISSDLREWVFLGEVLGPGEDNDWDDQSTWTGSVIAVADGWQMYYTAARRSENGLVQRICRATSPDLYAWTKDDSFVLEADPRWYEELDLTTWFDLTWRDPWVYFDEAAHEYRMLITARAREGAVDSRGVIGLARSNDLDYARERKQLNRLRREPSRTLDGVDIKLYANAESREDVADAHALGAAGVGLYRTEFLFLQRAELPTEDEQFRAYRDVVLGMTGRMVTLRTLDLGADKADRSGLALRDESNPALGLRGVRLSLARAGLLDTQLRAMLRASGYGALRILLPMVCCREEILAVRARLTWPRASCARRAGKSPSTWRWAR